MVVKVYISGISGNKEVKKRQQRVLMIMDSKNIPYEVIDITEPGKEGEKDYMQTKSTSLGATISDTSPRHPLPPQLFNDTEYCGDYDQFDLANEIDTLEQFLKVEEPSESEVVENNSDKESNVTSSAPDVTEVVTEQLERNGISSSRETSVEAETKTNGEAQAAEEVQEETEAKEDVILEAENIKKDLSPSEELILNEQAALE